MISADMICAAFIDADGNRYSEFAGYEMHMFFRDRGKCLNRKYKTASNAVAAISAQYLGVDVDGCGVVVSIWSDNKDDWLDYPLSLTP
jgi:hypothetical protein